jgi:hypothetical protein
MLDSKDYSKSLVQVDNPVLSSFHFEVRIPNNYAKWRACLLLAPLCVS